MFQIKKKEQNGRQNIDFIAYVRSEIKLDLPGEVINYIYSLLENKTIGDFLDNLFPIMEKVSKTFPEITDDYLREHGFGMFFLEATDDITKKLH